MVYLQNKMFGVLQNNRFHILYLKFDVNVLIKSSSFYGTRKIKQFNINLIPNEINTSSWHQHGCLIASLTLILQAIIVK